MGKLVDFDMFISKHSSDSLNVYLYCRKATSVRFADIRIC